MGALREQLRQLYVRRNSLAPVSRIQSDTLIAIFRLCRDAAAMHGNIWKWTEETTHICQHWRKVALSSGDLWATPGFFRPHIAREMVQRAGTSPLNVVIPRTSPFPSSRPDEWSPAISALTEVFQKNAAQLRVLDLQSECMYYFSGALKQIAGPLPLLDTLILKSEYGSYSVPPNLHGEGVLYLNTLHLTGFRITHWEHFSMAQLTSLSLKNTCPPDFSMLLGLLRQAHKLQSLTIINSDTFIPTPVSGESYGQIFLPELRVINISECAPMCDALLSQLVCSLPFAGPVRNLDDQRTFIDCVHRERNTDFMSEKHVLKISSWLARSLGNPIMRLVVAHDLIGLSGTTEPIPDRHNSPIEFRIDRARSDVLARCIPRFPLDSLHILTVAPYGNPPRLSARDWHTFFGHAVNLNLLIVTSLCLEDLLDAMETSAIFPLLRRLIIICASHPDLPRCIRALASRLNGKKGMLKFRECLGWDDFEEDDIVIPVDMTVIWGGRQSKTTVHRWMPDGGDSNG